MMVLVVARDVPIAGGWAQPMPVRLESGVVVSWVVVSGYAAVAQHDPVRGVRAGGRGGRLVRVVGAPAVDVATVSEFVEVVGAGDDRTDSRCRMSVVGHLVVVTIVNVAARTHGATMKIRADGVSVHVLKILVRKKKTKNKFIIYY